MTYSQKLRDARWQRARLKVFERDDWKCQAQNCRSPQNVTLHVHHKRYLPNRDPWEYPLTDLISYCEKCHDRVHVATSPPKLVVGAFYSWKQLPVLLGFTPQAYLTEDNQKIICGCFRLDFNPDAPDIVLPGTRDTNWARKARAFFKQATAIQG